MVEYPGDPAHATIQLVTDNELRRHLSGADYPPYQGHEADVPIMQALTDHWKAYLSLPRRNVHAFVTEAESVWDSLNG
jgi:hypothetical protein